MKCRSPVTSGASFCPECSGQVDDAGAETVRLAAEEVDLLLKVVQRELAKEYDIQRELGRGGMAVVYQAVEVELGRRVALKVLPPDMAMSRSLAERFKREARMSAALDHPNIIPIYRVGQAGSLFYIAMKLVEGRALNEIIETQGALPMPVIIQLMRSATSALAYAHERGIVHRDVKCANVLIDRDGRALVSDFGIARTVEDPAMTVPGLVMGTPYFMSPEQCAARRIGPQSDQYSLGIVLFQLLTGGVPFHAESLPAIMHHHFYTPVPDVAKVRPDVPPSLAAVLVRALAKKPEERFATTAAMLAAVEAIPFSSDDRRQAEMMLKQLVLGAPIDRISAAPLPALPPTATPSGTPIIGMRPRRRRPVAGIIGGVAVVAMAIGASVLTTMLTGRNGERVADADAAAPARIDSVATSSREATPDQARDETPPARPEAGGSAPSSGRASSVAAAATVPSVRQVSSVPTRPAAATPAPPSPAAGSGLVRLRVYPVDADIAINGASAGRGVLIDAPLAAGSHRLRITAPGYQPFDTTFAIEKGTTTQISPITLEPVKDTP